MLTLVGNMPMWEGAQFNKVGKDKEGGGKGSDLVLTPASP